MKVLALVNEGNRELVSKICEELDLEYVIVSSISSPSLIPENSVVIADCWFIGKVGEGWMAEALLRSCKSLLITDLTTKCSERLEFDEKCRNEENELKLKLRKILGQCSEPHFQKIGPLSTFLTLPFPENISVLLLDSRKRIVHCSEGFSKFRRAAESAIREYGVERYGKNSDNLLKLKYRDQIYFFAPHVIQLNDYYLMILFDLTPVMSENYLLKEKVAAFRDALSLLDIAIVTHRNGKIVGWNSAAEKLLGEELEDRPFLEFFDHKSRPLLSRGFNSLPHSRKKLFVREAQIITEKGGLDVRTITTLLGAGRNLMYVTAIRNITAEKRVFRLLQTLFKIHEEISSFNKKRFVLQLVAKELEKSYGDVFVVSKSESGYEIFRGDVIERKKSINNLCIKEAIEKNSEVLIFRNEHPGDCRFERQHRNYNAFIRPLEISGKTIGYMAVFSESMFLEEELKMLRVIASITSHICYRSELEEIKHVAFRQLEANIRDFTRLVDRIKNPLAVISGFCEIHEEMGAPEIIFSKIREEIKKMTYLLEDIEKNWETSERIIRRIEKIMEE